MRIRSWIGRATIGVVVGAGSLAAAQEVDEGQATGSAAQSSAGARMELSSTELNFGVVWEGAPVKGDFIIKNVGDEPLTIAVKSSCGCTPTTKPRSPLPPGESTTLTIKYDTVKRRRGRAHQRVTLTTNDPAQPKAIIKVVGQVNPLYEATPADAILFNQLHTDSRVSRTIKFENKYDGPLKLKLKEGQDFGPFDIKLKEIEPGMQYELTAATRPPLPEQASRLQVVLETGLESTPEIRIRVQAHVRPDVFCSPSRLRLARQMTFPTKRWVELRYRADKPVEITRVQPSHESIKCKIQEAEGPGRGGWVLQKILVKLPPGGELPPGDAGLEIFTDASEPRFQKFDVRIQVLERAARGRRAARPPATTQPGQQPEAAKKP